MSTGTGTAAAVRVPATKRYDGRGLMAPGITAAYLGLLVLIPISAILWRSASDGVGDFWSAITSPQAQAALQLTLLLSAAVTLINALIGTLIAWAICRKSAIEMLPWPLSSCAR